MAIAAGAWLLGAVIVLLAFAGVRPGQPWSAEHELTVSLERFEPAGATLQRDGDALRIVDTGAQHVFTAAATAPFDAAAFRHLDIDVTADSVLLQGVFAWNVDGTWHTLQLPGFLDGAVTVDLAAQKEWRGQVQALGVALMPIDLVAVQHAPPREATLHALRLRSDSVPGALAAMRTAWGVYRPWNGRSNHSSGFELGRQAGPSLTAFVAALTLLTIAALALAGRAAARRAVAVALVALACWQVMQLTLRADVARSARAAVADATDWPLAGVPALAQDALDLEPVLVHAPPRIAIWGGNNFFREYPAWLLRRFNVGSLRVPADLDALRASSLDTMLLLVGDAGWSYAEATGELQFGSATMRAERVHDGRLIDAFRLLRDGAP